ncbi:MAG: phage head closure protein [Oscillospiraceae bacterium]|nr:phage head closure protein [Oscillospiraceae bacterium]
MNWCDVITLVSETNVIDDEGFSANARAKKRRVFANVKSATRTEFYAAKQSGVTIAVTFEVMAVDYKGERIVESSHSGKTRRYRVVRDYPIGGEIYELNCSLDVGGKT